MDRGLKAKIVKDRKAKIITQGIPGSFHFEACAKYFEYDALEIITAYSFLELAEGLRNDSTIDYGVMAIENSIAGSIIQNFKILREYRFRILGELYLPIQHNLLALPGVSLEDISEVHSHPMALNQCLKYLSEYPSIKLVTAKDTASSAKRISEEGLNNTAAIASISSANIYGLNLLAESIQTSKINYTRFVIIQEDDRPIPDGKFDKASIYIRTQHKKGSLLKVLQIIYNQDINLSKLQSYPVEDNLNKYYFYLDLEFETSLQYENAMSGLNTVTEHLEVLGVYKRHEIESLL